MGWRPGHGRPVVLGMRAMARRHASRGCGLGLARAGGVESTAQGLEGVSRWPAVAAVLVTERGDGNGAAGCGAACVTAWGRRESFHVGPWLQRERRNERR